MSTCKREAAKFVQKGKIKTVLKYYLILYLKWTNRKQLNMLELFRKYT